MARDEETLKKEIVKSGSIYQVDNIDEFSKWLGWIFTRIYDLFKISEVTSNLNLTQETTINELMRDPIFLELIDFSHRNLKEAENDKLIFNKIKITCGMYYAGVVQRMLDSGIQIADGRIVYELSGFEGSDKKAQLLLGEGNEAA